MEAYQERVVTECDELTERLGKLVAFIGSPTARADVTTSIDHAGASAGAGAADSRVQH